MDVNTEVAVKVIDMLEGNADTDRGAFMFDNFLKIDQQMLCEIVQAIRFKENEY